ncbi:MAG: type I restriction enzyme HsdR N-terminal domain-containing protein [Flavobacteriales bacterium]
MHPLHFPSYQFRLRRDKDKQEIWDALRRKWVALTPEEWVRQHTARFLVEELGYPSGRMALEYALRLNGMARRADLVVFGTSGSPVLLVECKAPDVMISKDTAAQAARYNLVLGVRHLLLTNGLSHFFATYDGPSDSWGWLDRIPPFREL